ncbi:aquaporin [Caulobacter sp.]|uniref:aquaporin n=1 Tax=Caulobacter sp. TaxID=78 RepID=UPI00342AD757
MNATLSRRLAAEALGTALLLAVVVGSGVMGQALAPDQDALALLGNTLATGAALVVLITIFGPSSGAHFNPAVSTVMALRGQMAPKHAILYAGAQVVGALAGVVLAHACSAGRSCRSRPTPATAPPRCCPRRSPPSG